MIEPELGFIREVINNLGERGSHFRQRKVVGSKTEIHWHFSWIYLGKLLERKWKRKVQAASRGSEELELYTESRFLNRESQWKQHFWQINKPLHVQDGLVERTTERLLQEFGATGTQTVLLGILSLRYRDNNKSSFWGDFFLMKKGNIAY